MLCADAFFPPVEVCVVEWDLFLKERRFDARVERVHSLGLGCTGLVPDLPLSIDFSTAATNLAAHGVAVIQVTKSQGEDEGMCTQCSTRAASLLPITTLADKARTVNEAG
jgi:hypothetical protein